MRRIVKLKRAVQATGAQAPLTKASLPRPGRIDVAPQVSDDSPDT
jgi:hypothetical protein